MIEFMVKNWIALLSLIIALTGGIPGLISLIVFYYKRPIFKFTLVNVIIGTCINPEWEKPGTAILLTGTLSNDGEKPLIPSVFDLKIKTKKGRFLFERLLMNNIEEFPSESHIIKIENPKENDLQRFRGSIDKSNPVYGHLKFIINTNLNFNDIISYKLQCMDFSGHKYYCSIKRENNNLNASMVYPKHGLTVISKK